MRLRSTLMLLTAVLLMAGCTSELGTSTTTDPSSVPTSPIETRVAINNFNFTPGDLLVQSGTTVLWQNRAETTRHTATAVDGDWDSGILQGGADFSFTFTEPGVYAYFCVIHPAMTGTVIVEG